MQTVSISHGTSRAGDPHRHIHMQIGTRAWAAGKWRALDTGVVQAAGRQLVAGLLRGGRTAWILHVVQERVTLDEAEMLDQDTARALLTATTEAGAPVALVGDRAQFPAFGRGGALDMAAQIRGHSYDMTELHRFAAAGFAALTLAMRDRDNLGDVF